MTSAHRVVSDEAHPIKLWTAGVPVEDLAEVQLRKLARLPFIHRWISVMPDVHVGKGATVGSVIPTKGALVPAAVGVDIGCGMTAVRTSLDARRLPDGLGSLRAKIERKVPHGRAQHGRDPGSFGQPPAKVLEAWSALAPGFRAIAEKHPKLERGATAEQLGTLGGGNHFIEVCLDEADRVWVMLHSGSRGLGNRIGRYFIERAREEMARWFIPLPDPDLAYLPEGTPLFQDYVEALGFAQAYARENRALMMAATLSALEAEVGPFSLEGEVVSCHHNYVSRERHYGEDCYVTRKGAVRAGEGELAIIPGSMGTRSYIVRGRGDPESFASASHGAGRVFSRTEARRRFTVEDHAKATAGIECRKDEHVLDETPMAYKSIDRVMEAQRALVEVVATLRQVLCVKG